MDIATVTDAIKTLIQMAHENEYADKAELVGLTLASIHELINENKNEPKENSEGSNS